MYRNAEWLWVLGSKCADLLANNRAAGAWFQQRFSHRTVALILSTIEDSINYKSEDLPLQVRGLESGSQSSLRVECFERQTT